MHGFGSVFRASFCGKPDARGLPVDCRFRKNGALPASFPPTGNCLLPPNSFPRKSPRDERLQRLLQNPGETTPASSGSLMGLHYKCRFYKNGLQNAKKYVILYKNNTIITICIWKHCTVCLNYSTLNFDFEKARILLRYFLYKSALRSIFQFLFRALLFYKKVKENLT